MSSRQIQYTIKLLSDIANTAKKDAQAVESSNARMAKSYDAMAKSADKQVKQLERTLAGLNKNAAKAGASLDKMGGGVGARMSRQLDISIAKLRKMKSAADGVGNSLQKIGKYTAVAAGGIVAGAAVGKAMIQTPVEYDTKAQDVANTAFHDRDAAGKIAGKAEVKAAVDNAMVSAKGGNANETLALLDKLVGGGMERDAAFTALPGILKAQIGTRMDAEGLGDLVSAMRNIKMDDKDLVPSLSEGIKVGQLGSFELPSMVKNGLAEMITNNKGMGMSPVEAFRAAIVDLQMIKKATGNDATAATDYKNLQAKIMSNDQRKAIKKEYGIDTMQVLQQGAAGGKGVIQSYMEGVVDKIIDSKQASPEVRAILAQVRATEKKGGDPAEVAAKIETIKSLDKSGEVAKIMPDMQAGTGLKALQMFKEEGKDLRAGMLGDNGNALEGNWAANTATTGAAIERKEGADHRAEQKALDSGGGQAISALNDGMARLKDTFPGTAAAATALTAALGIAAAAAAGASMTNGGISSALDWFRKRKKRTNKRGAPDAPDAPDAADLPSIGGTPALAGGGVMDVFVTNMGAGSMGGGLDLDADGTGSKTGGDKGKLGKLKGFARGAGKAGLIGAGIGLADGLYDAATSDGTRGEKTQMVTKSVGGAAGGLAGAEVGAIAGAAIGSFVPVLGTAIGAVVGGLIGGGLGAWGGSAAGDKVGGYARDAIDGSNAAPALGGTADTAGIQAAVASGVGQGMAGLPAALAAPSAAPPPAYLSAPALAAAPPPPQVAVTIQDGKLAISVTVSPTSELLSAVARAAQPVVPIMASLSGGSTNPAGYA